MRDFEAYNPITQFFYFAAVLIIGMFSVNPVILGLSLFGACALLFFGKVRISKGNCLFFVAMSLLPILLNPLFDHHGDTILFVLNDNPVTLEAVLYGIASGVMILASLLWLKAFSAVMTSDRLLYLFSAVSPKLALLLSMTLRYIPLFAAQTGKVQAAQKAIGLYKEDNVIDGVKGGARVFSVMVTWALENGIITADSMEARGYGIGRRTSFAIYRFRKKDVIFLLFSAVLFGLSLYAVITGGYQFDYYPTVGTVSASPVSVIGFVAFGLLSILPSAILLFEDIRWKYYQSKI